VVAGAECAMRYNMEYRKAEEAVEVQGGSGRRVGLQWQKGGGLYRR